MRDAVGDGEQHIMMPSTPRNKTRESPAAKFTVVEGQRSTGKTNTTRKHSTLNTPSSSPGKQPYHQANIVIDVVGGRE